MDLLLSSNNVKDQILQSGVATPTKPIIAKSTRNQKMPITSRTPPNSVHEPSVMCQWSRQHHHTTRQLLQLDRCVRVMMPRLTPQERKLTTYTAPPTPKKWTEKCTRNISKYLKTSHICLPPNMFQTSSLLPLPRSHKPLASRSFHLPGAPPARSRGKPAGRSCTFTSSEPVRSAAFRLGAGGAGGHCAESTAG